MKLNRITCICSLILFLISWGIKSNMTVERPSNVDIEIKDAWYEKEYSHIYGDDEWYLSSADPNNYEQVEGYMNIYQYKNIDGSIIYYRAKTDANGNVSYTEIKDFIP